MARPLPSQREVGDPAGADCPAQAGRPALVVTHILRTVKPRDA